MNILINLMDDVVGNLSLLSIELYSKCLDYEFNNDVTIKSLLLEVIEGGEFSPFDYKELEYKEGFIDIYSFITPDFFKEIKDLKLVEVEGNIELHIVYKEGCSIYSINIVTNKDSLSLKGKRGGYLKSKLAQLDSL